MTNFLIILLFMTLTGLSFVWMQRVKKIRKSQTHIVNDTPVFFTKQEIKELSKKNFLTESWYSKRPGKNKGK